MRQRLMVGLAALAVAAAGAARAELCAPDASFAALASVECEGGPARHGQEPYSFDTLAGAALHQKGAGPQPANPHARALNVVPEPGTTALLIAGLAAIAYRLTRRRS